MSTPRTTEPPRSYASAAHASPAEVHVWVATRDAAVLAVLPRLRAEGFTTHTTQTVGTFETFGPKDNLVILDGDLPVDEAMPVYELLEEHREIPALVLVPRGGAQAFVPDETTRPLDDFATKPIGGDELVLRIRALCARAGIVSVAPVPVPPTPVPAPPPPPAPAVATIPAPQGVQAGPVDGRQAVPPVRAAAEQPVAPIAAPAASPVVFDDDVARQPSYSLLRSALGAALHYWWVVVLLLAGVMAGDVYYTATRPRTYLARSTFVVSPSKTNVDRGRLVDSVDSLGRGIIVGTYTEVLGSETVYTQALQEAGEQPSALNNRYIFKSSSVGSSAVIQLTVEGPTPQQSAQVANLVGEIGIRRMADLYPIYDLVVLTPAEPPTTPYRPDIVRNYALGGTTGLVFGVLAAYLLDQLRQSLRRRRRPVRVGEPSRTAVSSESQAAADPGASVDTAPAVAPRTAAPQHTWRQVSPPLAG